MFSSFDLSAQRAVYMLFPFKQLLLCTASVVHDRRWPASHTSTAGHICLNHSFEHVPRWPDFCTFPASLIFQNYKIKRLKSSYQQLLYVIIKLLSIISSYGFCKTSSCLVCFAQLFDSFEQFLGLPRAASEM